MIVSRRFCAPSPEGHVDTGGMAGVSVRRGEVDSSGTLCAGYKSGDVRERAAAVEARSFILRALVHPQAHCPILTS